MDAAEVMSRMVPDVRYRHLLYLRSHRRVGNFRDPRTFNEKVNWRILNDRRECISWTCDKLAMKDYASRMGINGLLVPETLWIGQDLRELRDASLEGDWVLKPNHASSRHIVFGSGPVQDFASLSAEMRGALDETQARVYREWAYLSARRTLLVERRIPTDEPDAAPTDYKFLVFDGRVAAVQVHVARLTNHAMAYYSTDWTQLGYAAAHGDAGQIGRPRHLPDMIEIAQVLAAPYDFMRVDLYCERDEIYFGELTPYPGGGLERFTPVSLDSDLGALWKLPPGA